ncbi:MAG TPA: RecX family transcriptional regulator [Patescibacteria group bacterium]|nr:RecX family transcriptional regulator [Patescibacteria group bacterium]
MPVITAIKPQKKKEKFNIFLDGKFAFSLPSETLVKEGLHADQEISRERVEELIKESELGSIFDKVLKFLSFRPRSEFEINEYLLRKKVGEETRKMVRQKLKALKLIDDEAFAQWWIEQRSTFRPSGVRLVKYELRRKGIAEELIKRLLAEERPKEVDIQLAEKLAQKKLVRLTNLPPGEVKQKLYAALAQKGFSFETIEETVAKILKKR